MCPAAPVVGLPEQLHVGQVGGLGDALPLGLQQLRVGHQLLLDPGEGETPQPQAQSEGQIGTTIHNVDVI